MEKEAKWLLKEKYNNKATKNFYNDIERLKKGEPLDYVIGFTEFLGCKIDLSKKPLIPRPETEFWVGEALRDVKPGAKILDIFAGSGCIGLAIVRHVKNVKVVFADREEAAITQIKKNIKINKTKAKVVESDVFSNIKGKYDFILANPPYIPIKKIKKIQKSVLAFEPRQALFGENDGLFYIKKFLRQAKKYLNSGGVIFMEFDPPQKAQIKKLLERYNYKSFKFHKDQYNRWRWLSAAN